MHTPWSFLIAALAAAAAGAVNALAGGGTLISFPALIALGLPAVTANVTNTVALCPGYLGGALAQKADLHAQRARLWILFPAGLVGGLAGGLLLMHTGERTFRQLTPFLILLASALLAVQEPVRARLLIRAAKRGALREADSSSRSSTSTMPSTSSKPTAGVPAAVGNFLAVALAAVYGGYFGAGLSVILLALLAILLNDSLTRLNALKQAIAFAANIAAATFFVFSGKVVWPLALVMAVAAVLGGMLGGRLAGRVRPTALRRIVVTLGFAVGVVYLLR